MTVLDFRFFADSAERMLDASGNLIRETGSKPFDTEIKDDGSPVTTVDEAVEDCIREIILQAHPDHGILGEERDDTNADAELAWTIDPIDGTLPFLAGFPVFGTLLGLLHYGVPVLGVIDNPMTRERWIGWHNAPTTYNGTPVSTRTCTELSQAMMSTSNPDFYSERDLPYLERMREATKLNVYGGSCMAYAQIATGRIDIGFDVAFDIHDYLPLIPVIEGAGGIVTDWRGDRLTKSSGDRFVACGDKHLHEQAMAIFSS